jgi:hypothetical protein
MRPARRYGTRCGRRVGDVDLDLLQLLGVAVVGQLPSHGGSGIDPPNEASGVPNEHPCIEYQYLLLLSGRRSAAPGPIPKFMYHLVPFFRGGT